MRKYTGIPGTRKTTQNTPAHQAQIGIEALTLSEITKEPTKVKEEIIVLARAIKLNNIQRRAPLTHRLGRPFPHMVPSSLFSYQTPSCFFGVICLLVLIHGNTSNVCSAPKKLTSEKSYPSFLGVPAYCCSSSQCASASAHLKSIEEPSKSLNLMYWRCVTNQYCGNY